MAPDVPYLRRWRLLAPAVVASALILGAWLSTVGAAASPRLPAQNVDQLMGRVEEPAVTGLSGTLEWDAHSGLPDLSQSGAGSSTGGFGLIQLLSGSHQAKVWDGAGGQRLAVIGQAQELDLYSSARGTWLYDSTSDTATHLLAPGSRRSRLALPRLGPGLLVAGLLAAVPADSQVSEGRPVYVAGRPAYVLVLAPRPGSPEAAASTVGHLAIAIDSVTGVTLRVSVVARGASAPALSVGFTSVRFGAVPASTFRFSAPPGAKVVKGSPRSAKGLAALFGGASALGRGWAAMTVIHGGARRLGGELGAATTPISGPLVGARLLSTGLVNAIVLPDGDVVAGLVTPWTLESAVQP